jgi:PAS domain S-box-containing protein
MSKDNSKTEEMTALRRKAESQLKKKIVRLREKASGDLERVLHELEVHQIELEMQNDELLRAQQQLEASRHKYADLYDFAPIGYFTFDTHGHVTEANLTGCKMLGVERKNLINKPFHSFVARDSQDGFHKHRWAALNPGQQQTCEITLVSRDGHRFEARLDSVPVLNDGQHVIGARMAVIDITERKQAGAALRESEERYRTFFEGSLDAVLLSRPDDSVEEANAAACEMFQMSVEELRKAGRSGIVDRSDPRIARFLEERAQAGRYRGELNFRRKDGTVFPGEISSTVFTGVGGVARTAMIIRDITERKKAEEAMRREAQILAQVHDCVVTTDLQGNITLWNRGAERVFGYSADEALGQNISLVYFNEDLPILSDDIIAPMLEWSENELEVRCRHKSGREVFLHLSLSVLRDENGSLIELIGYSLDITERKKAEEALCRSEQRLKLAQISAGAGVWGWDMTTGKLEWSEELFDLFGLDPAKHEASFETWRSILHPDDKRIAEERIERAIKTHAPHKSEYRIVLESGRVRWINSLGDTIYDDQGKPQRMSGICLDVTDRKLAEEQIRNIAKFPAENPFPVLRLSADGTILYSNTPGQVLLEQWNCQTAQKAPEYWCNLVRKALRYSRNQVERTKCGDRIYSFTITPVNEGEYVNLYGRDITIQEQVKGFLRKSRDMLEERVRERTAELVKTVALLEREIEQRKHTEKLLKLEEARLEALVHVSTIHEGSVDAICHFILEQGIALTNSKIGFIGFLSEDESAYTLHAVSKAIVGECDVVGNPTHWPVSSAGIWAEVIKQRKTLFINDYCKAHPGKKGLPAGHVPLDRFMIVPLFEGKRIVVVAGLGNKASSYDTLDERQMTLLLAGMWNYVQRKRSAEAIQQRTAELSRVNIELEKEVAERRRAEQALWERSRDLDAFFSHTITPLVILDRKFNFVRVNKAYAEADQRDISEFAGHNHFEFYPHKENERIFKKVVRTKKPYHALAKPFSYPDHPEWGVTYWDWTLVPVLDEAGKVQLLILSLKDVTESKRTELRKGVINSLLELFAQKTSRKEYLDSVVEIIRNWSGCECVGIRITSDDGRIPYESSVGFSKKFLSLENNLSLHKDACVCIRVITQASEAQDSCAMTARGSFRCEDTFGFVDSLSEEQKKRYQGNCPRAGFASIAVVPVRYRQEILGAIHLADKSQNKAPLESVEFLENMALLIGEAVHRFDIEQSLRLNEERLLEAQRIAHLGNWQWEIATNKLWWSDEVCRIVGVKPRDFEATYEAFLSYVHPDDREFVKQSVSRAVYDRQPYDIDHRIILPDGTERIVHERAEVTYDADENHVSMIGTIQDVTEQKRAEAELLEQRRQLRSLTAEMQISEERERRQIAADLHDSVGQILAFSARELAALQKSASSETAESLHEVWGQLEKAIQLTRTLTFDLSPSVLYDLGFEVAIEDLIEQFSKKQNIRYGFESCREFKPLTYPMKILLYRSVRELLINISKHAKAKTVRISLIKLNNDICITVEDDGIGIDLSLLKSGVQRPKGFGLFSIRERLAHIGGQFRMESARGRGTKVTMLAPLNLERKDSSDEYPNSIS